jgi:hypothetical protein
MLNSIVGLLDAGVPVSTTSYESIATVSVGAGGQSTITFSSIPSTYKHLQLRIFARTSRTPSVTDSLDITINSDTGANYAWHTVAGGGTSAVAASAVSQSRAYISTAGSGTGGNYGAMIVDILDYANTNKYKTLRTLSGTDANGSGAVYFESDLWMSTSAINRLDLVSQSASTILQYSSFALYGIKG